MKNPEAVYVAMQSFWLACGIFLVGHCFGGHPEHREGLVFGIGVGAGIALLTVHIVRVIRRDIIGSAA